MDAEGLIHLQVAQRLLTSAALLRRWWRLGHRPARPTVTPHHPQLAELTSSLELSSSGNRCRRCRRATELCCQATSPHLLFAHRFVSPILSTASTIFHRTQIRSYLPSALGPLYRRSPRFCCRRPPSSCSSSSHDEISSTRLREATRLVDGDGQGEGVTEGEEEEREEDPGCTVALPNYWVKGGPCKMEEIV
jgi:hypothetical protein